jgi:E3 ubiquitin-protein ligase RNF38/44
MTDREVLGPDSHAEEQVISIADPVEDDVPDTARMLPEVGSSSAGAEDEQHTTVNVNNNDDDGEDVAHDNAVGAEAHLLNMQNEIARPMSFLGFLRRGNFFLILYFIPVTVALITVLIVDWSSKCNRPLKAWACTQVAIQSLMIVVHILFLHKLQNPSENERRHNSPLIIVNKILNFLWFAWFVVGMVWTFQALAEDKCTSTAPYLFRMCFSLMIIQIIILSLGVLFCCCSCVVLILRVVVNPVDRGSAPRGASSELINSLPTKRFKDGVVKKEDASCAICLSDYEADEVVRFLPCGHHYHRNCVDKWLVTNKACPFCKRNVDEPPPSTVFSASSPSSPSSTSTVLSSAAEEPPQEEAAVSPPSPPATPPLTRASTSTSAPAPSSSTADDSV